MRPSTTLLPLVLAVASVSAAPVPSHQQQSRALEARINWASLADDLIPVLGNLLGGASGSSDGSSAGSGGILSSLIRRDTTSAGAIGPEQVLPALIVALGAAAANGTDATSGSGSTDSATPLSSSNPSVLQPRKIDWSKVLGIGEDLLPLLFIRDEHQARAADDSPPSDNSSSGSLQELIPALIQASGGPSIGTTDPSAGSAGGMSLTRSGSYRRSRLADLD